jgi:hypothetical protein
MAAPTRGRRRAKVSVTVDPTLLEAVDLYVQRHADLDRSKVMEAALTHWYAARQEEAMIAQFTGPDSPDRREARSWQNVRRAAVSRKLTPRAS